MQDMYILFIAVYYMCKVNFFSRYFEAHLLIKATSVQKSHRTEESYLPLQSIPHYKVT